MFKSDQTYPYVFFFYERTCVLTFSIYSLKARSISIFKTCYLYDLRVYLRASEWRYIFVIFFLILITE